MGFGVLHICDYAAAYKGGFINAITRSSSYNISILPYFVSIAFTSTSPLQLFEFSRQKPPKNSALRKSSEALCLTVNYRNDLCNDSLRPEDDESDGKDILGVNTKPLGESHSGACVDLFHKLIVAPALLRCTEKHVNSTSEGKDVVGDDKVLKVKDNTARTERFKA